MVCSSRAPVGYCTCTISIIDGGYDLGPSFEVEPAEVWVEPRLRQLGVRSALAAAVAGLSMSALDELLLAHGAVRGRRLALAVNVAADVYSTAGARFVYSVAEALQSCIDDASTAGNSRFRGSWCERSTRKLAGETSRAVV